MNVRVFYRRNRLFPIVQSAGDRGRRENISRVVKMGTYVGNRRIITPIVQGSHIRGKVRAYVATDLLRKLIENRAITTSAEIGTAVNLIKQGNLNTKQGRMDTEFEDMLRKNPYTRIFGYMTTFTTQKPAGTFVSHVLPIFETDKDAYWEEVSSIARGRKLATIPEEEVEEKVADFGGGVMVKYPFPLTTFIPQAPRSVREYYVFMLKAVRGEVNARIVAELEKEITEFFGGNEEEGGKKKGNVGERVLKGNIIFQEIFTPVADLVQEIRFGEGVEEETARGFLYALRESVVSGVPSPDYIAEGKASGRVPGLGGKRAQGFGFIDEVIFLGEGGKEIEPTKEDYMKFVEKSMDTLPDIIKKAVELVGGR